MRGQKRSKADSAGGQTEGTLLNTHLRDIVDSTFQDYLGMGDLDSWGGGRGPSLVLCTCTTLGKHSPSRDQINSKKTPRSK